MASHGDWPQPYPFLGCAPGHANARRGPSYTAERLGAAKGDQNAHCAVAFGMAGCTLHGRHPRGEAALCPCAGVQFSTSLRLSDQVCSAPPLRKN